MLPWIWRPAQRCTCSSRCWPTSPDGIVLVTTCDGSGEWRGVTTSSFCGVSLDPVSACLYTTADCYRAFREATRLCVSFLRAGHQAVAARFATKGGSKFASGDFAVDLHGMHILRAHHGHVMPTLSLRAPWATTRFSSAPSPRSRTTPARIPARARSCAGKGSSCPSRPSSAL